MKSLLREFVRAAIREVDVLPGGQDAHAQAAMKLSGQTSAPSPAQEKPGQPKKGAMGKSYQSKEDTRKKVQDILLKKIRSGGLSKDEDIQKFLADEDALRKDGDFADGEDVKLAVTALRGVPMSVWQQIR